MVGRYATPEADVTITHHLPPPEDESIQEASVSFMIPPQVDASNLLDQNYDDFFSGPGFVTLSTPVLPRHLAGAAHSLHKVTATIQTPAVLSGPNLGRILAKNSTTELDPPNYRTELQQTHISAHSSLSLSPSTTPSTSAVDPGPPRLNRTTPESNPDSKIYDGPTPNRTPSTSNIITTESSGTRPGIQSTSGSDPSLHSTNPQNAQISRQFPTSAAQMKYKAPLQPRVNTSVKPNQTALKSRSGGGPDCELTTARAQSRIRGGAVKRLNSTLSNHSFGGVKGRIGSNPACSNPRSNVTSHIPLTGNEHSDPDSLDVPAEGNGGVTQSLVTIVLPPSTSTRSRFNLEPGGADMGDCLTSLDPPRTAEDRVGVETPSEVREDDEQLTVSRLSPSKTVGGWCDQAEKNEEGSAPTPGTPIAVSPMRPSKKRASSAGQESDNEPDSAWPDEWEKQCLVVHSNREGEVRGGGGGGEGKRVQGTRRVADSGKALQPRCKKPGGGSSSLTLMKRLKAKAAVRESPRARKLRDKFSGRAGRRKPVIVPDISRDGRAGSVGRGFPGNAETSTTPSVAMLQGKGCDRVPLDETTGPWMPYSGDNEGEESGVIKRSTGSAVGGPSFRSTLKRSTVPVEFRFELAARLGTGRGSARRENPGPSASGNEKEGGGDQVRASSSRKRPKLDVLGEGGKNGEVGVGEPTSSSRLKDVHRDQIGSGTGAWKGKTHLRSNISSAGTRSQRKPLIVPEGFRFSTEQRAKEREEFDRGVRVKQEEKERRLEEERAAKAVEEEQEMKEMRKRAVPKASGIPEWYAAMPKRKAG